jgi:hypothetical protein
MKRSAVVLALAAILPAWVYADAMVGTELAGFQEVPSVNSKASGRLRVRVNSGFESAEYRLTFSGLQGTVQQAHIHFAQGAVNGPIVIWLCGTPAIPGPAGTPTCPQSGVVQGHIDASNVLASPSTQQLPAGAFTAMVNAMISGAAYANVHTSLSPAGEIRGQMGNRDDE